MLTDNQQTIIDSLHAEFNRINNAKKSGGSFSLIDVDALNKKSREIREFKDLVKKDKDGWTEAAKAEAFRVADLLQKDLPDAGIAVGDDACIKIFHKSIHAGYCDNDMAIIRVEVKPRRVEDNHGNIYHMGEALIYSTSPSTTRCPYDTIEKAVKDPSFLDALRNRVINRQIR